MKSIHTLFLKLSFLANPFLLGSLAQTCLEEAPLTVYETGPMSPQNMDFDTKNNMFVAHSGWYNDADVHYYKFRMYTPITYPGLITPGGSFAEVPIQKVYFVTSDGGFGGIIGRPVIEYHSVDGNLYSDFMEVQFVTAPENYVQDTFKSVEDITESGAEVKASGIIVNFPVVPTGSFLQDPIKKGTVVAPIDPVPVWYKCTEVWTYVFEVTHQSAADYFAYTRTVDPDDFSFAIPVKPSYANKNMVIAIPLIHVNQFSNGVTPGVNGGGPSPAGMKNVINLDRADDSYSPLWHILWMTQLPINYNADEASNFDVMLGINLGFEVIPTPMYVNCPDIGPVDPSKLNPDMGNTNNFQKEIDGSLDSNWIMGSHQILVMQGGVPVSVQLRDGTEIASITTNMMGAYEYELMSSDIPSGTTEIKIVAMDTTIRVIPVVSTGELDTTETTEETEIEDTTETETESPDTASSATVKVYSTIFAFVVACIINI